MYLLFGFPRWLNGHFVISSRFVVLRDKQQFLRKSFYYTRKTDWSLCIVCTKYIFTSSFRPRFANIGIGKNNNNLKERNKIRRCVLCTIIMMLKTTSRFSKEPVGRKRVAHREINRSKTAAGHVTAIL